MMKNDHDFNRRLQLDNLADDDASDDETEIEKVVMSTVSRC